MLDDDTLKHTLSLFPDGYRLLLRLVCAQWARVLSSPEHGGKVESRSECYLPSLPLLRWAVENGCPLNDSVLSKAVNADELPAVIWLLQEGCMWRRSFGVAAAMRGHLSVLLFAWNGGYALDAHVCMGVAAEKGHLSVLVFFETAGHPVNEDHLWLAVANGHLCVAQWVWSNCSPAISMDENSVSWAARGGHLEMLFWLSRVVGCHFDEGVCAEAAYGGHLHVLQWLRRNGCPWSVHTCAYAARNNHLHVLEWAYANGCECNEIVCEYAASQGRLQVLRWLRQRGCPWDVYSHLMAMQNGHVEVANWLAENGCPVHTFG